MFQENLGLPHEEVDPEKQVSLICDSAESDKTSSPPCALFGLTGGVVATEAVARRRSEDQSLDLDLPLSGLVPGVQHSCYTVPAMENVPAECFVSNKVNGNVVR